MRLISVFIEYFCDKINITYKVKQYIKRKRGMNHMLTAVGFLMLLVIVVLLLTGKVSLPPIFVVVPVVACMICGFGLGQINDFIGTGLKRVEYSGIVHVCSVVFQHSE